MHASRLRGASWWLTLKGPVELGCYETAPLALGTGRARSPHRTGGTSLPIALTSAMTEVQPLPTISDQSTPLVSVQFRLSMCVIAISCQKLNYGCPIRGLPLRDYPTQLHLIIVTVARIARQPDYHNDPDFPGSPQIVHTTARLSSFGAINRHK